jgi:predicted homoserine dehydrogenase-like protein
MELVRKLEERKQANNPIQVGIVGCGQMGSGLAHTINNVTGMTVAAIADIDPKRGIETFVEMGHAEDRIVVTESHGEAEDAVKAGIPVVTPQPLLLPKLDKIEANVEATGVPDVGAAVALDSIMTKKPVIMLNVETDITIGYYLNQLARKMGSVYTVASGDEPGVCKMLYEQAVLMGFEVVCLGKGKNNVIDFDATPESCREEALSKDMNPKILSSFKDGTKTMVEMAAVSNATGLLPDIPGMHGPLVELDGLAGAFIPKTDGGIFSGRGNVDFSTGKIAPGVFAIVYAEDPRIRKDMKFITKAEGPYYLHFRPYHLCDLETPQSVAEAVLLGEITVTAESLCSEVVCVAKRDLKTGTTVGGIGGTDWLGRIYTYPEACSKKAIPIGIAAGGKVIKDIRKGELLTEDSFEPDDSTIVYRIRKMQDSLFDMNIRAAR